MDQMVIDEKDLDWVEDIKLDMLPPFYAELAELIGIKNAIKVGLHYQGIPFYLTKLDKLLENIRNKKIREEFTGGNYAELAIKYNLTERWIRKLLEKELPLNKKGLADPNQINFFDTA